MSETNPFKTAIELLVHHGLIAYEWSNFPEDPADKLFVIRPSSAAGTPFRGWRGKRILSIGRTHILTDAPEGIITRDKSNNLWTADISIRLIPGPSAHYFHHSFETLAEAATALIECFFADRVRYDDPKLKRWLVQQSTNND